MNVAGYKLADARVLCARWYGSHAEPMIAAVPRMIFSSTARCGARRLSALRHTQSRLR
jgi:hypothetical protein